MTIFNTLVTGSPYVRLCAVFLLCLPLLGQNCKEDDIAGTLHVSSITVKISSGTRGGIATFINGEFLGDFTAGGSGTRELEPGSYTITGFNDDNEPVRPVTIELKELDNRTVHISGDPPFATVKLNADCLLAGVTKASVTVNGKVAAQLIPGEPQKVILDVALSNIIKVTSTEGPARSWVSDNIKVEFLGYSTSLDCACY
jgi:hypothetical protein